MVEKVGLSCDKVMSTLSYPVTSCHKSNKTQPARHIDMKHIYVDKILLTANQARGFFPV